MGKCEGDTMLPLSKYIAVLIFLCTVKVCNVHGSDGCTSVETYNNSVINMCEGGSWTMRAMYVSVTSDSMGSRTRCNCTLTQTGQEQEQPVFKLERSNASSAKCEETFLKINASGNLYSWTCTSSTNGSPANLRAGDITVTAIRPDVFHGLGYCLSIIQQSGPAYRTLTCQGATPSTPSSPSSPSSISSTLSPVTSSPALTSSSAGSTPTSPMSSSSSPEQTTSAPGNTWSTAGGTTSDPVSSNAQPSTSDTRDNFPVAPVAGGIAGGVALLILIVVVVVCTRKKRQTRSPGQERPGVPSVGYENVLVDNVLYESSSAPDNNQPPPPSQPGPTNGRGGYENVHENGGGPSDPFYSAPGDLATVATGNDRPQPPLGVGSEYATVDEATRKSGGAQPGKNAASAAAAAAATAAAARQPTSDEYAVVNKPGRHQKPADSGNAAVTSPSADVTLPSGDVYAVVDKSRTPRHTSPPETSPPPAPAPAPASTPGLNYADLDLVREEGSAVTPRSSAEIPAASDYAEIDHTTQSVRM